MQEWMKDTKILILFCIGYWEDYTRRQKVHMFTMAGRIIVILLFCYLAALKEATAQKWTMTSKISKLAKDI